MFWTRRIGINLSIQTEIILDKALANNYILAHSREDFDLNHFFLKDNIYLKNLVRIFHMISKPVD
jgi:hypothetical protein